MLDAAILTLIALGAGMILVAGGLVVARLLFLAGAARTEGRVVALKGAGAGAEAGGPSQALRPVVRFPDRDGRAVEFTVPVASSLPRYRIGDPVPVRFDPRNPSRKARVESFLGLWFAPALLGGLALPVLLSGIGLSYWRQDPIRDLAELRRQGTALTGVVLRIDHDEARLAPDGKPLYVLMVEAKEPWTGRSLSFRSEPITAERRELYMIGDKVQVIFDPSNPDRYHVNLE